MLVQFPDKVIGPEVLLNIGRLLLLWTAQEYDPSSLDRLLATASPPFRVHCCQWDHWDNQISTICESHRVSALECKQTNSTTKPKACSNKQDNAQRTMDKTKTWQVGEKDTLLQRAYLFLYKGTM